MLQRHVVKLLWEELKKCYPCVFVNVNEGQFKLELVIAEEGQASIYEAKYA